jgi:hypothetical protein
MKSKILRRNLKLCKLKRKYSDAKPYLPTRTEAVKVKLGIENKTTVDIGIFEHVKLGTQYIYIYVLWIS